MTQAELNNLRLQKMKLDKFFSMYLDKYGDKLDSGKPSGKYWDLYNSKLKEYNDLEQQIRVANYKLGK